MGLVPEVLSVDISPLVAAPWPFGAWPGPPKPDGRVINLNNI